MLMCSYSREITKSLINLSILLQLWPLQAGTLFYVLSGLHSLAQIKTHATMRMSHLEIIKLFIQ